LAIRQKEAGPSGSEKGSFPARVEKLGIRHKGREGKKISNQLMTKGKKKRWT